MQRLEGSEGGSETCSYLGESIGSAVSWGKALQGSIPEVCGGTVGSGWCKVGQKAAEGGQKGKGWGGVGHVRQADFCKG